MNNYEYILSCLPALGKEDKDADASAVMEEVRSLLEGKDLKEFSLLDEYYSQEGPGADFYRKAAKSGCRFIREYFAYDRTVRNSKVSWINRRLERPALMDIVTVDEDEEPQFSDEALAALQKEDTIEKEKGLDDLMWEKAESLSELEVFSLNLIVSFIVRLKIVDRWQKLDAETGRALLKKLVEEIRNSRTI